MSDVKTEQEAARPNCIRCRYYYITWEPKAPKGCRAHGFKSADFPHNIVIKSSGIPCQLFEPKPAPDKS